MTCTEQVHLRSNNIFICYFNITFVSKRYQYSALSKILKIYNTKKNQQKKLSIMFFQVFFQSKSDYNYNCDRTQRKWKDGFGWKLVQVLIDYDLDSQVISIYIKITLKSDQLFYIGAKKQTYKQTRICKVILLYLYIKSELITYKYYCPIQ